MLRANKPIYMLFLLLTPFVFSSAFAYDATVKKSDITVIINDKSTSYVAGESFTLKAGDIICFDKGNGRVVIKGSGANKSYKKQLSKRSKSCKHLPDDAGKAVAYAENISASVVSLFQKSKEKALDGISRANKDVEVLTAPISIKKSAKYLAIENSSWGPLPIALEILNEKNEVVEEMENEADIQTSFIIPASHLKEGYSIRVLNSFEDEFINSKIHFQK